MEDIATGQHQHVVRELQADDVTIRDSAADTLTALFEKADGELAGNDARADEFRANTEQLLQALLAAAHGPRRAPTDDAGSSTGAASAVLDARTVARVVQRNCLWPFCP